MATKKITLGTILAAVNMDAKNVWKEFDNEERKSIGFWVLNRHVSSVSGNKDTQESAVLRTNEFYNKHYMIMSKHPELQWQLLCLSARSEKIEKHKWIGLKSRVTNKNSKYVKILEELYPNMKIDDLNTIVQINTEDEIKQLIEDHAVDVKL